MPRAARCAFYDCTERGTRALTLGWDSHVRLWLWLCEAHLQELSIETDEETTTDEHAPAPASA